VIHADMCQDGMVIHADMRHIDAVNQLYMHLAIIHSDN